MRQRAAPGRIRAEDRSQQIGDLIVQHRSKIIAGVVVLALLVAGAWFYRRSVVLKEQRSEIAYFRARQAAELGNFPLAESDLRNVADRYQGTAGGAQAVLWLGRVLYEQAKYEEGIAALRSYERSIPRLFSADLHALLAAGHESAAQLEEAAQAYERAAAAARFPQERKNYQAAAARAHAAAGQNAEALAIWRELEADPDQTLAAEARVRIGELAARPAGG